MTTSTTPEDPSGRADRPGRAERSLFDERFAVAWAARSDDVHTMLDDLAARAPDDVDALDTLLALVDRHGLARSAIRRILISEDDVADAEQATLAAVGLHIAQFDGRSRFTTWLHRVASNEAKMFVRARSRRPVVPAGGSSFVDQPFIARLSTLLADRDVIDRALHALAPDFREPLQLRELDGLSYDEIAAHLDIPIGTVRSRINRARAMLATEVRAQLDAGH